MSVTLTTCALGLALTIHFGAGVKDALGVMREPGKMHAILLALQLLCMFALLTVVYLQRVIVASYNGKLAGVVEIERGHRGLGVVGLEALQGRLESDHRRQKDAA